MNEFKIGEGLKIHEILNREGVNWYSDDIYYVVGYISAGTLYHNTNKNAYEKCIYDLILTKTICGKELTSHRSRFYLFKSLEETRDEKLKQLI